MQNKPNHITLHINSIDGQEAEIEVNVHQPLYVVKLEAMRAFGLDLNTAASYYFVGEGDRVLNDNLTVNTARLSDGMRLLLQRQTQVGR